MKKPSLLPLERVGGLSASMLTGPDPKGTERRVFEEFSRRHTTATYRDVLDHCYARWNGWKETFFGGKLGTAHIGIGRTPSRRLSQCRPLPWGQLRRDTFVNLISHQVPAPSDDRRTERRTLSIEP